MVEKFARGDKVDWSGHGGKAEGTIEKTTTERTGAAGRTVAASEDDPQYLAQRRPMRTDTRTSSAKDPAEPDASSAARSRVSKSSRSASRGSRSGDIAE